MEIVKNLQRLQGIDGDYDNDSGSGPDRIARRKTIQNLEKARQPRRQIGTLDVAFKKRFLKLTADAENNPATPILTRRLTMRAETIRALEVRKNSVMAERRKSAMQTLGAKNEYGITTGAPVGIGFSRRNLITHSNLIRRSTTTEACRRIREVDAFRMPASASRMCSMSTGVLQRYTCLAILYKSN